MSLYFGTSIKSVTVHANNNYYPKTFKTSGKNHTLSNLPSSGNIWIVPSNDVEIASGYTTPINIIGNNMSEPIAPVTQKQVTPNIVINDAPINNNNITIPVTDNNQINEQVSVVEGTMNSNIPNPQAEKLAIISDPSLGNAAGLNLQPNVARKNNAGNIYPDDVF